MNRMMRHFRYTQLPEGPIRETSVACCELAETMDENLPEGPEKTAGLRKLVEAKDCFVRAKIEELEDQAAAVDPVPS